MRARSWILVPLLCLLVASGRAQTQNATSVATYEELVAAVLSAVSGGASALSLRVTDDMELADAVTLRGIASFALVGDVAKLGRAPVLTCVQSASVVVADAMLVRIQDLRVEGCTGPAVWLQSSRANGSVAQAPVSWTFSGVTFSGNMAQGQPLPGGTGALDYTASALLLQPHRGLVSITACTFASNGKGSNDASLAYATPAMAVMCVSEDNCSLELTDSSFTDNVGVAASALLLQSASGLALRMSGVRVLNNTVRWMDFPEPCEPPFCAPKVEGTFLDMPAAAVYGVFLSTSPATVSFEARNLQLTDNSGGFGALLMHMQEQNHPDSRMQLVLDTVTLAGHTSGPAAFMALGATAVDAERLDVQQNRGGLLVEGAPNPFTVTFSSGSVVCFGFNEQPGAAVRIAHSSFNGNDAENRAVLLIASYRYILRNDIAPADGTSTTLVNVSMANSNTTLLAVGALISTVSSVDASNCSFTDNHGGALIVENGAVGTFSNVTFERNVKPIPLDFVGNPAPAVAQGAGVWITKMASVTFTSCRFIDNWAEMSAGGAVVADSDAVAMDSCYARNNSAATGGAMLISDTASASITQCTFEANSASNGGAIAVIAGGVPSAEQEVLIKAINVTFTNNVAAIDGGALWLSSLPRGAVFDSCSFVNNTALSSSAVDDSTGINAPTVHGGGAIMGTDLTRGLSVATCTFLNNTALGGAGGALNIKTSLFLSSIFDKYVNNTAGTNGGALYLSNMAATSGTTLMQVTMSGNRAGLADTWDGESGFGGAIYLETSILQLSCSLLSNNTGKLGGALHARLESRVALLGQQIIGDVCAVLETVDGIPLAATYSTATQYPPQGHTATQVAAQYATVLANNTALVGGALYVEDSTLWVYQVPGAIDRTASYGVLFANNTANVGGAMQLHTVRTSAVQADFVGNRARAAATAMVAAALGRQESDLVRAKDVGMGGAVAVVGSEHTAVEFTASAFANNSAWSGGGLYLTSSEQCSKPASCYTVQLIGCVMTGNTARGGGGGGVYWDYPRLLNITCAAPSAEPPPPAVTAPPSAGSGFQGGSGGGEFVSGGDGGLGNEAGIVGGNGSGFGSNWPGVAVDPTPPTTPLQPPTNPPPSPFPPSPPLPPPPSEYHRAQPLFVPDAQLLACDSWSLNAAIQGGFGPDVASTPFSLDASPHYNDFYTSSSPITTNLSVLDYYGQLVSGGNNSVIIRAVSVQVLGQTYMASIRGEALFNDLKLRAQSGWHDVDFAATTPYRELNMTGMSIYVRPCGIGEYLSPTMDQCLACSPGYYNFNQTAHICRPCINDALCSEPDYPGMIVPVNGTWHSNFFSEQVVDCPNGNACEYSNRTQVLSQIQQQVMNLSRAIQASLVIRPNATIRGNASVDVHTRLLLQERYRQLREMASEIVSSALSASPAGGGSAGDARSDLPTAERERRERMLRELPALVELRQQLRLLQESAGENSSSASPYGAAFNDDDYTLLLQAAKELATKYRAAMCSPGYEGTMCGTCAAGYGSTGPGTCRLCPNHVYNTIYYVLAMALTLVMLAWTIRSLLYQGLVAADNQRFERKTEVMGEMRLMGRPLVNPGLMAVLDEDELPESKEEEPIYGPGLPPKLEGLIALRKAYLLAEQSFIQDQHQQQGRSRTQSTNNPLYNAQLQGVVGSAPQSPMAYSPHHVEMPMSPPTLMYSRSLTPTRSRAVNTTMLTSGGGSSQRPSVVTSRMMVPTVPPTPFSPLRNTSYAPGVGSPPGSGPSAYSAPVRDGSVVGGAPGSYVGSPARTPGPSAPGSVGYPYAMSPPMASPLPALAAPGRGYLPYSGSRPYQQSHLAPQGPVAAAAAVFAAVASDAAAAAAAGGQSPFMGAANAIAMESTRAEAELSEREGTVQIPDDSEDERDEQARSFYASHETEVCKHAGAVAEAEERHGSESGGGGAAEGQEDYDEQEMGPADPRDSAQERQGHAGGRGGRHPWSRAERLLQQQLAGVKEGKEGDSKEHSPCRAAPSAAAEPSSAKTSPDKPQPDPQPYPGKLALLKEEQQERLRRASGSQRGGTAFFVSPRVSSASAAPARTGGPIAWLLGSGGAATASAGVGAADVTSPLAAGHSTTPGNLPVLPTSTPGGVLPAPLQGRGLHSSFLESPRIPAVAAPGVGPSSWGIGRIFALGGGGAASNAQSPEVGQALAAGTNQMPVSPRQVSATGMPAGFMAEVIRRQNKLESRRSRASLASEAAGPNSGRQGSAKISPSVSQSHLERMGSAGHGQNGIPMYRRSLGNSLRSRLGMNPSGGGDGTAGSGGEGAGGGGEPRWGSVNGLFGRKSTGIHWDDDPEIDGDGEADDEEGAGGGGGGGGDGWVPAEDREAMNARSGAPNSMRPGNEQTPLQDAACIKIFIGYIQILALVRAVPIPSPPQSVMNYLRFYDQITAIPGSLVSLDCSLPHSVYASKAMQRVILSSLAPLYVSLVVALVWAGLMLWAHPMEKRTGKHRPLAQFAREYLPPRLVMSFATVMFYFYPNTCKSLLSILSCISVDSEQTDNALAVAAGLTPGLYWTMDFSERCFVGRHLALTLGLGVTGLLFIALGWPLAVAVWLYKKAQQEALDFSNFSMVVYASYRELYRQSFLFWESAIMLRQMAVAAVVVLMSQSPVTVQMLVVIAVVAAAFAAQIVMRPFRTVTMNRLEEVSLVVIIITLYLNLYFISPTMSTVGRTLLASVIIAINAATLGVFVYFITRTSWEKQLYAMGLDRKRVYEMEPQEIQDTLRQHYGQRTAALLTRVVTGAQTVHTIQHTMYRTGSTAIRNSMRRISSRRLKPGSSGRDSMGRTEDGRRITDDEPLPWEVNRAEREAAAAAAAAASQGQSGPTSPGEASSAPLGIRLISTRSRSARISSETGAGPGAFSSQPSSRRSRDEGHGPLTGSSSGRALAGGSRRWFRSASLPYGERKSRVVEPEGPPAEVAMQLEGGAHADLSQLDTINSSVSKQ